MIPSQEVLSKLDGANCCLVSNRIYVERGGRNVEFAISYYDPSRFKYTTTLLAE